ncbi:LysR family transcriptional regulator [Ruminococcus sp. 5_1_39BFAA]|uniref:LysR family transcriptional regulator n=1 Tax=Ruminococcus sp. 5_1_39BFAA TaxID=457412 RepID=UPI003564ABAC
MELKYLYTFQTIVEEGSFSKAAEKLNYTQSTITFQIGQLEQELSAKLFEKIGRRMVLTKAGEQLIPYVNDVLNSVERMHCFESDLSSYQGSLHIGVGETLLCYKLPSVLKDFCKRAPKARLFLHSMNCYDIRNELLRGTLDLGLFYEEVGGLGSNLTIHPFGSYPVVLVASPDIKAQYPDFITPNQQISIPFIINEPTCIFRQIFEQYLRDKSIVLDHTIELWSIPTIKNLVRNNVGITFLPRFSVEEELKLGSLVEIPTDMSNPCITAVCGKHANKWQSPLMELFVELCTTIV